MNRDAKRIRLGTNLSVAISHATDIVCRVKDTGRWKGDVCSLKSLIKPMLLEKGLIVITDKESGDWIVTQKGN
jgi:hypothetical protein